MIQRLGSVWVEGSSRRSTSNRRGSCLSHTAGHGSETSCSSPPRPPRSSGLASPLRDDDGRRPQPPAFYEGAAPLPVGDGLRRWYRQLLARIERLRNQLAQEGLFDPARKKPLPYLPRRVGLITGRGSAAERRALGGEGPLAGGGLPRHQHARPGCDSIAGRTALRQLDDDPSVDVIIIARGGGPSRICSLLRRRCSALVAAATPVVSAIGHEAGQPVLDNVADLRAATPTDAAKRVVPDVAGRALLGRRGRMAAALRGWVQRDGRAGVDTLAPGARRSDDPDRAALRRVAGGGAHPPRRAVSVADRDCAGGHCARRSRHWVRRRPWPAATRWCRSSPATAPRRKWS